MADKAYREVPSGLFYGHTDMHAYEAASYAAIAAHEAASGDTGKALDNATSAVVNASLAGVDGLTVWEHIARARGLDGALAQVVATLACDWSGTLSELIEIARLTLETPA